MPTVFIVDDDASVGKALARLLRCAGYQVEVFNAAAQYLERTVPVRPACLVVDIRMPGMTGVELQRRIEGTQMALPIVFITGHGDDSVRDQTLSAGAIDVLSKPVDDHELLAAIDRALWRSLHPDAPLMRGA